MYLRRMDQPMLILCTLAVVDFMSLLSNLS